MAKKELHQIGLSEPRDPAKDWKQARIYQLERERLLFKIQQLEKFEVLSSKFKGTVTPKDGLA